MSRNNKKHRTEKKRKEAKRQKAVSRKKHGSKRNDGKSLEHLVKTIEQAFLGSGFTVTPNVREGNAAEFDLVIEGKLGTSAIKWDIECRDRPSDGPAPGSWIEQLVGRRDRFNFDKLIAVSTTGFAKEAAEYAKEKNIVLRTVSNIADVSKVVRLSKITVSTTGYEFLADYRADCRVADYLAIPENRRPKNLCFVRGLEESERVSLDTEFRRQFVNCPNHHKSGEYVWTIESPMRASDVDSDEILVQSITYSFRVRIDDSHFKALSVQEYAEDEKLLGRHVQYEGEVDGIRRLIEAYEVFEDNKWRVIESISNLDRPEEMRKMELQVGEDGKQHSRVRMDF